ncbi:MAG: undecaprenyl-diphosphate phosphatase [Candidatus Woesearchaeota archaeon]
MFEWIVAIILGVVEGITEFLPISSTGHLIIISDFLKFTGEFSNAFNIIIQLGAILAVIWYFRKKLFPFNKSKKDKKLTYDIWKKTLIGVIPAIIIGGLIGNYVEENFFNPIVVAIALIIGGIILIIIERKQKKSKINTIASLTYGTALMIGIIQCLALIPGTSRSAATIIGAMLLGASRLVAAEYSFYLAIPTIIAASAYSLINLGIILSMHQIILLAIGFVVSFIVALGVIALFMKYITTNNFKPFGYYRIILGIAVLAYYLMM